jgi:hypothetical protein
MTPGPFSGPRALGEREQQTLRDRTVLSHRRVWLGAFETRATSRDLADLVMGDPSRMFWPGWNRYFSLTKFVTNATPPAVASMSADLRLLGLKDPSLRVPKIWHFVGNVWPHGQAGQHTRDSIPPFPVDDSSENGCPCQGLPAGELGLPLLNVRSVKAGREQW